MAIKPCIRQFYQIFICAFLLSSSTVFGQEIKTKVKESGFDVQREPTKEETFQEANLFVYAGGGVGIRTGNVLTGLIANTNDGVPYASTTNADPFKLGYRFELGGRYYFKNNFGIGVRTNVFFNTAEFKDVQAGSLKNDSKAETQIYSAAIEGLYRMYFSEAFKQGFAYGGIGLGSSYIVQDQTYNAKGNTRKTVVDQAFYLARPFLGVAFPATDIIYIYGETGYAFSQGKLAGNTLSLSQFQVTAGVQIRLNSF